MKRLGLLLAAVGLTVSGSAFAAGGHALPYSFSPDPHNTASIQRGAKNFTAYCSGCHSMSYLRYNRIGNDLGVPEDVMAATLMPEGAKPGDQMVSSMPAEASKGWFGQTPPDLTLESRARGPSWVYSYLMTFYKDDSRPLGVNNLVLPGASMPHVLWELQGVQVMAAHEGEAAEGEGHAEAAEGHGGGHGTGLELEEPGKLSPEEYQKFVGDIVNFMAYAAEPGKAARITTGKKAVAFLLILLIFAYFLKKEFWKDVH